MISSAGPDDPHSFSRKALRQTSSWVMLATLARPSSGFLQVKASGIESFFCLI